jgi:predicted nuclease of predicted toxin-antitoxin system
VTKDSDFVDSFILQQEPWKLLLVSTGNISNTDLIALFLANIEKIAEGFDVFDFIELSRTDVIVHF